MLPTTTVRVERWEDDNADPYETTGNDATVVTEAWPVHVSSPSGADQRIGGDKEIVSAILLAPPTPVLARGDVIVDELTDETYRITWLRARVGLGLDHQKAGLLAVKGGSNG